MNTNRNFAHKDVRQPSGALMVAATFALLLSDHAPAAAATRAALHTGYGY